MIHLGKITADAAAILAMTVTAGTDVTAMTVTAGADVTAMTVTAMTVTAGADVTAMTVTAMTVTAGADVTAIGLGNDIDGAVSAAPFFIFSQSNFPKPITQISSDLFFPRISYVSISLSYT
ncbi:hypothetical protein HMPREF0993_02076 [Lachnospiraceae bacterium 5_1_57FAA]|nr:hypothetical protein HMPREF0993_02076 [Lachnospiraceae bacterium 5_1_57FAA]